MQETSKTQVQSLSWQDPLEEGMAIHSSILAWRIPWTEEAGGLQFIGSQRVRHDWSNLAHTGAIVLLKSQPSHQGLRTRRLPVWGPFLTLSGVTLHSISMPVNEANLRPESLLWRYTAIYWLSFLPVGSSQLCLSDLFLFISHIFMKGEVD